MNTANYKQAVIEDLLMLQAEANIEAHNITQFLRDNPEVTPYPIGSKEFAVYMYNRDLVERITGVLELLQKEEPTL